MRRVRPAEARGAGGWAVALATLGVGFLPGAPGTYASLVTVVALGLGATPPGPARTLGLVAGILVLSVLGTLPFQY